MADETETGTSRTRDAARTAKLALGAVLLVLLVLFVTANTDDTDVDFLFGEPVQVPLIVVLLVTALLGAVIYELFRFKRSRG